MSFSVELAFKTILNHERIFYKREHKLDELFELIPERTRKFILRYLNINSNCLETKYDSEQEFIDALKPIGDLFIKYRYFFDEKYDVKHFNKDLTLLFCLFYFLLKYINYKLK